MKNANGAIIYRGPSMINARPIVVVITGLANASANDKTGNMLQTWILDDTTAPHLAPKLGADASVCGDCRHRGINGNPRTCYVTLFRAPLSVWSAYKRGSYRELALPEIAALGRNRAVRLGAYGDPMAAPLNIWQALTSQARTHTGYTHQWRSANAHALAPWRALLMASCDSVADLELAHANGWRTFRVMTENKPLPSEVLCPASAEAGKRTTCAKCTLCSGTTSKAGKSAAIVAHGATAKHFVRLAA